MYTLLAALLGYLLGSIPFGFLFGRLKGIDLRQHGSGATGGTNVSRTLGLAFGIATGLLDAAKGAAAVWLGGHLAGDWGIAAAAFMAMVGHSYPVWLGFKGGKGVATGGGALLVLHPVLVAIAFGAMALTVWPTRYVSLGSLVGTTVLVVMVTFVAPLPIKLFACAAWLLIFWRHRSNISRLLAGTERKLGQKVNTKEGQR
jgi:glycerol-3-phosphate acyltransferase PlsY